MKSNNQNSRRTFLSRSIKGSLLVAGGLSSFSLLESFVAVGKADNEVEFRMQLGMLGTLSLMTSQIALTKAVNPKVKMFAKFEAEEQKAVATVLKELSTPMPPVDTKAKAVLDKLNSASGAMFDKAFMQAQLDTHEKLKSLTSNFVSSASGSTAMAEMHTRHIATVALATIKEHTEKSKLLLAELA